MVGMSRQMCFAGGKRFRVLREVVFAALIVQSTGIGTTTSTPQPISRIQNFASNLASKLSRKDSSVVVAKASAKGTTPKAAAEHEASLYSSFLVPLLAGGAATAFGDLAVHPLDTIKTVQQAALAGSERSTLLGACKGIMADKGIPGFYKGVGPFVLLDGLAGCVKFATYEVCKKFAAKHAPEKVKPYSHFAAAAVAFFACSVVLVPGELLKQTLQAGKTDLVSCIAEIAKTSGPKGFYQGYGATLVRDVPYTMLELGLYENAKRAIEALAGKSDGNQLELLAAALVGGFTGYVTNPLDIVKTRLMTRFRPGDVRPSVLRVFVDMWTKEGPGALMAGSVVRACWLIPFTAIYLPAYDQAKRWLLGSAARPKAPGTRSADSLVRVPD